MARRVLIVAVVGALTSRGFFRALSGADRNYVLGGRRGVTVSVRKLRLNLTRLRRGGVMLLINHRTEDGSRHFVSLPKNCSCQTLSEHILLLPGAKITSFVAAGETEALDFTYQNYEFSVSHRRGRFCFFVHDPQCPDLNLCQVAYHCEQLLSNA